MECVACSAYWKFLFVSIALEIILGSLVITEPVGVGNLGIVTGG